MSKILDIIIAIIKAIFEKKTEKKEEEKIVIEHKIEIPEPVVNKDGRIDTAINEDLAYEPEPPEPEPVKEPKRLVYQTELHNEKLNKYGCAFRCYQAIGELTCEEYLTVDEVEKLGEEAFTRSYLVKNAEVKKPEEIAMQVVDFFGKKGIRIYNSGYRKDGEALDWGNKKTDNYDYIVTKLFQKNKKDNHFVLCNKSGEMIFDPTPNSISASLWNVDTEYLYRVKK